MHAISDCWIDCREIYNFISFFPVAASSTSSNVNYHYRPFSSRRPLHDRFDPDPQWPVPAAQSNMPLFPCSQRAGPWGTARKSNPSVGRFDAEFRQLCHAKNDPASVSVQRASTAFTLNMSLPHVKNMGGVRRKTGNALANAL